MILIIQQYNIVSPSIQALIAELTRRNVSYFLLETWQFPQAYALSLVPGKLEDSIITCLNNGQQLKLSNIQSVYWVYAGDYLFLDNLKQVPMYVDENKFQVGQFKQEERLLAENKAVLGSLFRSLSCLWVDPIETIEAHLYKAHHQAVFEALGYRFPKTLVTNQPDAVKAFYTACKQSVIYKPCWMGAFTSLLKREDLSDERLALLKTAPVTFQEYIAGFDILALVLEDDVFACRIHSPGDGIDFRKKPQNRYLPIRLPEQVIKQCQTIAKHMNSHFLAIDMRYSSSGEHVFLEANPSPAYMHIQEATEFPITHRLADFLTKTEEKNSSFSTPIRIQPARPTSNTLYFGSPETLNPT